MSGCNLGENMEIPFHQQPLLCWDMSQTTEREGCSAMKRENAHHFLVLLWASLYLSAHTLSQPAVGSLCPYCPGAVLGGSGKTA